MNNSTIDVKRLTTTEGDKESYPVGNHLSNIDCYIEPTDPKVAVMFGEENAFKTYLCVINEILDIKITDQVTDQDSTDYRVGGVQKFNNNEIPPHMELIMYKKYEN